MFNFIYLFLIFLFLFINVFSTLPQLNIYPPKALINSLKEAPCPLISTAMPSGTVKQSSTSVLTQSSRTVNIESMFSFSLFCSALSSHIFFPKSTSFLMKSGSSSELLNLRSMSKLEKYLNNIMGGVLAAAGSKTLIVFYIFWAKSFQRDIWTSSLKLLKMKLPSRSPFLMAIIRSSNELLLEIFKDSQLTLELITSYSSP